MFFQKKTRQRPSEPIEYPTGSFIETEIGYWWVKGNKRYRILSERVLKSWSPPRVSLSSEAAAVNYKRAGRLGFRDGSLLHNIKDGTIYLVSENKRRPLAGMYVFDKLHASLAEVIVISDDETKLHEIGETLN